MDGGVRRDGGDGDGDGGAVGGRAGGEEREGLCVATYNITDGRCAGLESAGRALEAAEQAAAQ